MELTSRYHAKRNPGRAREKSGYIAETTKAIVSSPMAASNKLWHQRATRLSMLHLLYNSRSRHLAHGDDHAAQYGRFVLHFLDVSNKVFWQFGDSQ